MGTQGGCGLKVVVSGDTRWVWSEGCCEWGHKVGVV